MMGLMRSNDDEKGTYSSLQQNLVGPDPDQVLRTSHATPMMEVIAPANLQEGYEFEAQVGSQSFTVAVPLGGVEMGQKFLVPFQAQNVRPTTNVPVGAWKDSILDCCSYGPCHNHFCISSWCVPLAVGQVISRLKLTWNAKPGSIAETTGAFQYIAFACAFYWTIYVLPYFFIGIIIHDDDEPISTTMRIFLIVRDCFGIVYFFVSIYLVWNLRTHVREKYGIAEYHICPAGSEDFCMALCCTHLTAAQILRHTADYDTYNATCCTDTGLPSNAPAIV